ncbi:hypothetical protein POJ06DRAFT_249255 [Lipomyces tetrasporus]|uniref:Eisosome protein 1 n=1 Tax=Lipomyces tetrasporus TaxID=54092 RepID=A0AAD7VVJ4_9ASCO|nr:uncharacterized protein POJ06DRAFT_249255 [Lipomyces tetrasporus]KAJ8102280.1 hypothetical protein POJ06DRAFT_249255 [Lipomyces tetrasporus]
MLATGPNRSNATQEWVNSTTPPARRPSANRLPSTELTTDDQLRNSAASAAIVSTSQSASMPSTSSGKRASGKHMHGSSRGSNASEGPQSMTSSSSKDLAAAGAKTSLRTPRARYANPTDLPSHPIVGVDLSASNKAAVLARNAEVKSMWKPTGTSSTAASAAMLAHSSPKSPEIWKPDPSLSAGLAAILSKDPKYTITSQTGSGTKSQMSSSQPSRLSAAAAQKQYAASRPNQPGHHTPPLSPKMDAVGAGKYAMGHAPSAVVSAPQSQESYSLSASAARNVPPTPPSPVEVDDSQLSRGAAGTALYGKQPRPSHAESAATPLIQVGSMAALEHAAKRAAAARLSKIGEPQPAYILPPSPRTSTHRPVTAVSGAESASRRVQLEHQAQVDRALRENDKSDAATRHEMLLGAAQRNVQAKLVAMDKEVATASLFGNKEFNAMALAVAEQEFKGKQTADQGKFDVGGGVLLTREEVHEIAQRHVQPVLAELNEKAFEQRERDEIARQEKEQIKAEKAEEKARKKEEKAEKKMRKEVEKQIRKEGKEEEKQRKREEKQRKKEERDHEKELKLLNKEDKKKEKKAKRASATLAEISAAVAVPIAPVGVGEVSTPAAPTEHVNVAGEAPTGPTVEPGYYATQQPSGEGYETPIEGCTTAAPPMQRPCDEGYETPIEACPTSATTAVPESSGEGYETPIEGCTAAVTAAPVSESTGLESAIPAFPDSSFRTEGYETPIEACPTTAAATVPEVGCLQTVSTQPAFPESPVRDSAFREEGYETPIDACPAAGPAAVPLSEPSGLESATLFPDSPVPECSFPGSSVRGTDAEEPSSAATEEDGFASQETDEPEVEDDIETGYEYVRPEDIVDETSEREEVDEPNGGASTLGWKPKETINRAL